ncbi:MAG: GNAT family N-acetyltransferase [Lachnospiraceae bacterium]|nr:GNAT family N-acetyltransferase [Lachnospiraceae bacterium]
MDICTAGSLDKKFILDLYQKTFPLKGRQEFSLIERRAAMGEMEILLIREERKPVGFAILAYGERLVLLDYLAIAEKYRGQGLGSAALELIRELYDGRQFFLENEESEDGSKAFFLHSGFCETGIHIEQGGDCLELLSTQPELDFGECERVYRSLFGANYRDIVKRVNKS